MKLIVPYVTSPFRYACSETVAEMFLNYYDIFDWDAIRIHKEGYKSFEGTSETNDLGIENFFNNNTFNSLNLGNIKFNAKIKYSNDQSYIQKLLRNKIPVIARVKNPDNSLHTILLIGYTQNGYIYHCPDTKSNKIIDYNKFNEIFSKYMEVIIGDN